MWPASRGVPGSASPRPSACQGSTPNTLEQEHRLDSLFAIDHLPQQGHDVHHAVTDKC